MNWKKREGKREREAKTVFKNRLKTVGKRKIVLFWVAAGKRHRNGKSKKARKVDFSF